MRNKKEYNSRNTLYNLQKIFTFSVFSLIKKIVWNQFFSVNKETLTFQNSSILFSTACQEREPNQNKKLIGQE